MAVEGYTDCQVDCKDTFITIKRTHPITRDSYILIANTAYSNTTHTSQIDTLKLKGQSVELVHYGWKQQSD